MGEQTEVKQLPTEVMDAWHEYLRRVSNYSVDFDSDWKDLLLETVLEKRSGLLKLSGPWAVSVVSSSTAGERSVLGVNSVYSFKLAGLADQDWLIKSLNPLALAQDRKTNELDRAPESPRLSEVSVGAKLKSMICQGLRLGANWFPSMVRSTAFKWQSIDWMDQNGRRLLRAEFRYRPDPRNGEVIGDGFVLLDPENSWLIRSARTQGIWGGGETGDVIIETEFDRSIDEFPLPTNTHVDWVGTSVEGNPIKHRRETRFSNWRRSQNDESEFRIAAFGIPEPNPLSTEYRHTCGS